MAYTQDGIMAQMFVAFGQGAGAVAVSREASAAFYGRYHGWIDETILAVWETEAVQILERVRAIGRRLAFQASLEGRSEIAGDALVAVARGIEEGDGCPWCPVRAEQAGCPSPVDEPTTEEAILGQMLAALGQGTGTMRVSHEVCRAFRARYHGWIDGTIVTLWDTAAVQILERVRAIGRLLTLQAGLSGRTAVAAIAFEEVARFVEKSEDCPHCPIRQEEARAGRPTWTEESAALPVV